MKRIPAARQTASVPPTVVAPTAPCTAAAARSRGPTFRAEASKRSSSVLGEADHDLAVEHADRRRHGAARADARPRTRARPRRPRRAGSRARRASSRARRRRGPRRARRAPRPRSGSRHRPELRAAAGGRLEPERGAADEEAGRERVARAGRVDDLGRRGRERPRRRRRSRLRRASRPSSRRASPNASRSRSSAKTRSGASGARPLAERVVDRGPRAEVERDARARRAGELGRAQRRGRDRLAVERVAGDVERVALEPRRRRARPPGAPVAEPRSEAIERSPPAASETTTPVRPSAGPATSTPRAAELARRELAGRVGAALADEARLGAERRRPRGHVRGLPAGADERLRRPVGAGDERPVEADDHVEEEVAEGRHAHASDLTLDDRGRPAAAHPAPLVRARRPRRRGGRDRDRAPPADARAGRATPPPGSPRSRTRRATSRSSAARRSAAARRGEAGAPAGIARRRW